MVWAILFSGKAHPPEVNAFCPSRDGTRVAVRTKGGALTIRCQDLIDIDTSAPLPSGSTSPTDNSGAR